METSSFYMPAVQIAVHRWIPSLISALGKGHQGHTNTQIHARTHTVTHTHSHTHILHTLHISYTHILHILHTMPPAGKADQTPAAPPAAGKDAASVAAAVVNGAVRLTADELALALASVPDASPSAAGAFQALPGRPAPAKVRMRVHTRV